MLLSKVPIDDMMVKISLRVCVRARVHLYAYTVWG